MELKTDLFTGQIPSTKTGKNMWVKDLQDLYVLCYPHITSEWEFTRNETEGLCD